MRNLVARALLPGNDSVDVVVIHQPFHVPHTFPLNYPAQVLIHRTYVLIEEFGDLLLAQPKSLVLEVDLDAHLALGGV